MSKNSKISTSKKEKSKGSLSQNPDVSGKQPRDLKNSSEQESSLKSQQEQDNESPMRTLMRGTAPDLTEEELDYLEQTS